MLAQNFKTAADLGISEVEVDALIKVLGMLERGEIGAEHFDMSVLTSDCGTVGCIAGWAYYVSGHRAFRGLAQAHDSYDVPSSAEELFFCIKELGALRDINRSQAAIALRSYLTTGEANWAEALASA